MNPEEIGLSVGIYRDQFFVRDREGLQVFGGTSIDQLHAFLRGVQCGREAIQSLAGVANVGAK